MTVADPLPSLCSRPLPHLIDLLPDSVWLFDRHYRLTGWNRAASRLYGLPADATVGQSVLIFVPHEGIEVFARAAEAVRRDGTWAGTLPTRTALGESRLVKAKWVAAGPASDPISAIMAVHADVTARRRQREAAERAARWRAARAVAAAVAGEANSRDGDWIEEFRRFAAEPDPVSAASEFRGCGETVLVGVASPVRRELTRGLLEAAGYNPVTAASRVEAGLVAVGVPSALRAAVLAFGAESAAAIADLRRVRPTLPVVVIGGDAPSAEGVVGLTAPADPAEVLRAVAEAVAADYLDGCFVRAEPW